MAKLLLPVEINCLSTSGQCIRKLLFFGLRLWGQAVEIPSRLLLKPTPAPRAV
jgi:hypothetical protein